MTPQATLDAVRELSERATLRPAPKRLRLTRPEDLQPALKPAPIPYEELHPLQIGGSAGTAGNHRPHKPKAVTEHVTRSAMEKDWMLSALEKTEAATERRPVVIPAGW